MPDDTKSAAKSKLNWTGLIMVLLGAVTDPMFQAYFGDLIPPEIFSKVMFVSGWAVIALRTFGTSQPVTFNWKEPWKN